METSTAFALLSSAASTAASTLQQRAAARSQAAQVEAQRRREVQAIQQKQAIEERRRREQLRRDQAAQRARFAGAGINASGGSAGSVLTGLAKRVDQEIADARSLNNLRIQGINDDVATKRRSLLDHSRNATMDGVFSLARRGINLFADK